MDGKYVILQQSYGYEVEWEDVTGERMEVSADNDMLTIKDAEEVIRADYNEWEDDPEMGLSPDGRDGRGLFINVDVYVYTATENKVYI